MKIIEENGRFKLDMSQKELEYNLEMLLKANNEFTRKLNLEEIKRISEISAKKLKNPEEYPIGSANNASEFYKIVQAYWFSTCQKEILENYSN